MIAAGAALLLGAAAGVGTTGAEGAEGEEDGIPPGVEESKVSEKPNRLIHEKSPYLLQHAHNPVDWYPWGEEAFEKARKEGKPIFLSIGYSTCHWCHVMERESFENEEIARYLNEHFVSIKVDREERPDVDGIYMDATQAMNRRGGWPLSAFLRPDGKPFFTGTYFPPDAFLSICEQIVRAWEERREKIDEIADAVAQHLRESAGAPAGGALEESHARNAYLAFRGSHDRSFGGFGTAPKFPRTSILDFLMRYERRTGEREALDIVENTLDHMIRGGIRDHLAGGFHRYSTDRRWLLPHFEKMLYDNALITRTLLDAYRISGRDEYLRVAGETLEYLLSKMRSPEGAFYSAEDADAAGEEGLTYVWTRPEIIETLGEDRGEAFCEYYGVRAEGNFEPERPGEEAKSLNVLHIALEGGEEELASKLETPLEEVRRNLAEDRAKLLAVRSRRPQPFLDDKVLVEWNGLAISALAHAYQAIGEERYLRAAEKAADFIATRMEQDGRLQRRYRAGEVAIAAFLEDYAFFTEGLIDLYEAGFDERWLREAVRLGKETLRLFWDGEEGGFFSSAADHEELIARRKEFYDGAVPSGNSVAFSNLVRLREITGDPSLDAPIRRFQEIAAGLLEPSPTAHPQALCAAEFLFQKPLEIVIVGPLSHETTRAMLSEVQRRFLPSKVVLHAESGEAAERLASLSPLLESRTAIGGDPTAFVCRDRVCKLPARDRAGLRSQLDDPPPAAE